MMKTSDNFFALTKAWLILLTLTLIGLGLNTWCRDADWLPALVAALIWLKGTLVAQHFIEAQQAHPFIRRMLQGFIAFAPVALIFTAFFGPILARWATL